jgi:trehalose 6-phosphate synthase
VAGARRKLIVVSNRGPVTFCRDAGGARAARRGGGGLVTALRRLAARHDVTWIASAMSDEDRAVVAERAGEPLEETARDGAAYRLHLVAADTGAYHRYYNVVANPTLWFIQHYLFDLANARVVEPELLEAWSEGYLAVNAAFADAVVSELEAEPDSTVFFHDYHLYVAPRLVRDRCPDAVLAHFVHVPWVQPDYWHVLPLEMRTAIHDGLLANDLVGLHTSRWRDSFVLACEDILGTQREGDTLLHRDRRTLVVARPISVDTSEFDELAGSDVVLARQRDLLKQRPERLLLRVDRTDPSKNVPRGFRAYELYLERHPEAHGRVVMLALLDPTRQDVAEYAEHLAAIERAAEVVNDRFARDGWKPIDLRIEDDFPSSVAAYKEYDALLVNAVFDGLNLVAKEGPLVNERDGVLILSENAGAHEELGRFALSVNPFDVDAQAEAIHEALEMPPPERSARADGLRAAIRGADVGDWVASLLGDLDRVAAPTRA